jgi:hypothetical protein
MRTDWSFSFNAVGGSNMQVEVAIAKNVAAPGGIVPGSNALVWVSSNANDWRRCTVNALVHMVTGSTLTFWARNTTGTQSIAFTGGSVMVGLLPNFTL